MKFNFEEKDGKMALNLPVGGCWLGCAATLILLGVSAGAAVGLAKLVYRWIIG